MVITGNYADDKGDRKTFTLDDIKLDGAHDSDIISGSRFDSVDRIAVGAGVSGGTDMLPSTP